MSKTMELNFETCFMATRSLSSEICGQSPFEIKQTTSRFHFRGCSCHEEVNFIIIIVDIFLGDHRVLPAESVAATEVEALEPHYSLYAQQAELALPIALEEA